MGVGRRFELDPHVPLEALPEELRGRVGPDAPGPARLMAAKAMLPIESHELVSVLAYLSTDEDEGLAQAAMESLDNVPDGIFLPALAAAIPEPVLDFLSRRFLESAPRIEAVALNKATSDDAIAFIASHAEGRVLEIVATNQVRLLRSVSIVEALYFNEATPTGVATRAVETAVRGGLDISNIPGHKEIVASVLGESGRGEKEPEEDEEAPAPSEPEGVDEASFRALASLGESQDSSEDLFLRFLQEASHSPEGELDAPRGALDDEAHGKTALWKLVREMSVPQKIRLALMGNATARSILVRDPKLIVAMAVMRSPALSEKEISTFASNKTLKEEIIRTIAYSRDWTKNYQTRIHLVTNPKCPPGKAMSFLSTLRAKDLRLLARDKDVPSYVARQAKRMMNRNT